MASGWFDRSVFLRLALMNGALVLQSGTKPSCLAAANTVAGVQPTSQTTASGCALGETQFGCNAGSLTDPVDTTLKSLSNTTVKILASLVFGPSW